MWERERESPGRVQRLKVELDARTRHTDDLLQSTTLPPIPAALATKARELGQRTANTTFGENFGAPQTIRG
jgi:hypothetical protein